MSSFKNAKKSLQKTHRERGQPGQRKKFGLLEKHKDYVLRAKDFHRKEDHLKLLREKARNKNPDEFYYKMVKTKTKNGVHVANKNEAAYSSDQIKMLKSQDLNYARMKRAIERGKIERLKESLHFIADGEEDKPKNSHILFAEDKSEVAAMAKLHEEKNVNKGMKDRNAAKMENQKRKAYGELDKRIEREKKLTEVERGLQLQKYLMGKGRRIKIKKVGSDAPAVYKWRKERKK